MPQFDKPGTLDAGECGEIGGVLDTKDHCHVDDVVDPAEEGLVFLSPGGLGVGAGYTCAGGAEGTGGPFGQVVWENIRRNDSLIHATVTLNGVSDGTFIP